MPVAKSIAYAEYRILKLILEKIDLRELESELVDENREATKTRFDTAAVNTLNWIDGPKDWSAVHQQRMQIFPNAPRISACRLCGQKYDNQLVTEVGHPFVSVLCGDCKPKPTGNFRRRAKPNTVVVPKAEEPRLIPTNPLYLIDFAKP